jgi:hypothetical protein
MENVWKIDQVVLHKLVQTIEVDGEFCDRLELADSLGLTFRQISLSLTRLKNAHLITGEDLPDGSVMIQGTTERALRETGAWPSNAAHLADGLMEALEEAAEQEPEPEKKSKLKNAAKGVANIGKEAFTDIVASYLAKMSGA